MSLPTRLSSFNARGGHSLEKLTLPHSSLAASPGDSCGTTTTPAKVALSLSNDPAMASGKVVAGRRSGESKPALKEKFVDIYERLFEGETLYTNDEEEDTFWSELFLLKVNAAFLDRHLKLKSEEQLLSLRKNVSAIFARACETIGDAETNPHRIAHALETLCILLRNLFRKRFELYHAHAVIVLCPPPNSEDEKSSDNKHNIGSMGPLFTKFLQNLLHILSSERFTRPFQKLALELLLLLATANDNLRDNPLIPFFMSIDCFDPLCMMLSRALEATLSSSFPSALEVDALLLLAIMLQFKTTTNNTNPYAARLIALSPTSLEFSTLCRTLSVVSKTTAGDLVKELPPLQASSATNANANGSGGGGMFSRFFGGLFGSTPPEQPSLPEYSFAANTLLIEGLATLRNIASLPVLLAAHCITSDATTSIPCSSTTSATASSFEPSLLSHQLLQEFFALSSFLLLCPKKTKESLPSTNIFYALSDGGALCLRVWASICRDQRALLLLDEVECPINAPLYQKMISSTAAARFASKKPIATTMSKPAPMRQALLEVLVHFLKRNMRKQLPNGMYGEALDAVYLIARHMLLHRYRRLSTSSSNDKEGSGEAEKEERQKEQHDATTANIEKKEEEEEQKWDWAVLWKALIALMKFLPSRSHHHQQIELHEEEQSNEKEEREKEEQQLIARITSLWNLFIMTGQADLFSRHETTKEDEEVKEEGKDKENSNQQAEEDKVKEDTRILTSKSDQRENLEKRNDTMYDKLVYHIIHNAQIFQLFIEWVSQEEASLGWKLDNLSNIVLHFTQKINEWYAHHPEDTLQTPEQVMDLLRQHYHSSPRLDLSYVNTEAEEGEAKAISNDEEGRKERIVKWMMQTFRLRISEDTFECIKSPRLLDQQQEAS
ncbi:hypothetical protein QOT17_005133 [Balamuthia mandrillaris]